MYMTIIGHASPLASNTPSLTALICNSDFSFKDANFVASDAAAPAPVSNTVVCVEGTGVLSNDALPAVMVKNASGALVDTARIMTMQRGARQAQVQACSTASRKARGEGQWCFSTCMVMVCFAGRCCAIMGAFGVPWQPTHHVLVSA